MKSEFERVADYPGSFRLHQTRNGCSTRLAHMTQKEGNQDKKLQQQLFFLVRSFLYKLKMEIRALLLQSYYYS